MNSQDFKSLRGYLLASAAVGGLAFMPVQVSAQETGADTADKLTVTGSRIARADLVANSPVTVVDETELTLTNTVNTEQLLNSLPQVVPGLTSASNNPGNGTTNVNLRDLGASRTLVLVDGKRFIPTGAGGTVDINNIPASVIKRVEVVTGGASAVYGSDALAGVVNFILHDDFEGFEMDAEYQVTGEGDGDLINVSFMGGTTFDEGRGSIIFQAGYTDREAVLQGDRDYSLFALDDGAVCANGEILDDFGNGAVVRPGASGGCTTQPGLTRGGSLTSPDGVLQSVGLPLLPGPDGVFGTDDDIGTLRGTPDGDLVPFAEPGDRFNYAPFNFLQLPQERWNMFGNVEYEFSPWFRTYLRGIFVNTQVPTQLAPTPAFAFPGQINVDNFFLSPSAQAILADADTRDSSPGDGLVPITILRRRFLEGPARFSFNDRHTWQITAGIGGDIPDFANFSSMFWDFSFQTGRVAETETQIGNVDLGGFQEAVLAVDDGTGNPVCLSGDASCLPLNIFGSGNLDTVPGSIENVLRTTLQESQREQTILTGSVSGDWFTMPWASTPVGFSLGGEYREDIASNVADPLLSGIVGEGIVGFNAGPAISGATNVSEFFMEALIPVVEGMPFIESLEIEGGYRYSDYNFIDEGVNTYKYGGTWAPVQDLRFRGLFQRAVRAPNVGELFTSQSNGFPGAEDPCSAGLGSYDETAASNPGLIAQIEANCQADGVPASLVGTAFQPNSQIESTFGGNPGLQQETADTWTVGAVWQPSFVPALTVQVDYFDITIDGFITAPTAQTVLDACYVEGIAAFCSIVTRDSSGLIARGGIELTNQNAASLKTSGIDLKIDYGFDLADFTGLPGQVSWSFLGTWLNEHVFQQAPVAPVESCAGLYGPQCSFSEPKGEYNFNQRFSYSYGPATVSLRHRYLDSVTDSRVAIGGSSPDSFAVSELPAQHYLDLSAIYDLNENVQLSAGVLNLTDNQPPILGTAQEQANTFPSTYDTLGVQFFFGSKFRL